MKEKIINIKKGIKLHLINTDLFKTDLSVIFITIGLDKKNITKDVIIPEVLKSGSKTYKKQIDISNKLNKLYGSTLETGTDKTGKNLVLKLYTESVDDIFLPNEEKNLKECINVLLDITFNPLVKNDSFDEKYVEIEKERQKMIIESEKDDKDTYAYDKIINIMYNDCGYGIKKNGYLEDIKNINGKNLYERYKEIISKGKIDIFVSGNIENKHIEESIKNNKLIESLSDRDVSCYLNDIEKQEKEEVKQINKIEEKMDVTQGKLVVGLDVVGKTNADDRFKILLYNTILGDGANSKLFRIVREKESLAYTSKSNYVVQKSNIFIRAGIEVDNYNKTLNLIEEQLEDMRNGNFTEDDIENAKRFIYAGIDSIKEEQNTAIIFYYGEEMSKNKISIEEYYDKIKNISKEDIIKIAKKVKINTVYFLRN